MKILIALESKLGKVFNIMAFIRTIICLIIVVCAVSCSTPPQGREHTIWFNSDGSTSYETTIWSSK